MIEINEVSLRFENSFVVAKSFTAAIPTSSIAAIVGPSGCGKTTLLRAVRGVLTPFEGSIRLGGSPATVGRRDVWHSPQTPMLVGYRSVLANSVLGPELRGTLTEEGVRAAIRLLRQLGLEEALKQPAVQLSGGMAKRVGLAQALVADSSYLLLDEPFASLDVVNRRTAEEVVVANIRRDSRTCLFAAHDLDSVAAVADIAYVISGPPWFQVIPVSVTSHFADEGNDPTARRTSSAFSTVVTTLQDAVTTVSNLS